MPDLCTHRRFDEARCVLNADHDGGHGYAYPPKVSRRVWDAVDAAHADGSPEQLREVLDAVTQFIGARRAPRRAEARR